MTTNHPAHGPVSLDRLHQIREILSKAAAQSDGGNLGYAMADAVKVIDEVLEARNAEPVVLDETQSRAAFEKWCSVNIERNKWHPEFYAHLPAREQWAAWEACRAAMLQLYGNSEQLDEVGSWNNHRNTPTAQAGNSPVIPDGWQLVPKEPTEAMNKAGWAAMNEHDAINPTYRAMLAAAPQQEEVKSAFEHGMQRYAGAMQKLADAGD